MAFGKAVKLVRHAKISIRGTLKSGKTVTAAMLAAYIAKKYHAGKPVAFVPTEPGVDFVLNIFDKEGIPVIEPTDQNGRPLRSRDFTVLRNSIPDAVKAGAGVLMVDNLTHFREDLVKAYKRAKNINRKLSPNEYQPINEQWNEFTAQMTAAPLDMIVLGRLGIILEELEDDTGETDMKKIGNKMKAGSDTEYEVDLMAEMESRPDPDFGNAVNVGKGKRKKLERRFETRNIHVFKVEGCRIWALNGQHCVMKSAQEYKAGMCTVIGDFCAPYLDFLKSGDSADGKVLDLKSGSEALFQQQEERREKTERQIKALEEIKGSLSCVFTADTGKDAAAKKEIINEIFGTHSWTAVEKMGIDALEWGMRVCLKLKQLCINDRPEDRSNLLRLVQQAKDEVKFESSLEISAADTQPQQIEEAIPF